jgi:hypothetical protein
VDSARADFLRSVKASASSANQKLKMGLLGVGAGHVAAGAEATRKVESERLRTTMKAEDKHMARDRSVLAAKQLQDKRDEIEVVEKKKAKLVKVRKMERKEDRWVRLMELGVGVWTEGGGEWSAGRGGRRGLDWSRT